MGMIVLPCSVKTMAEIAHGTGDTLIPRAADVVLKERRRLVLGVREAPFHEIHLENMLKLTRMGVIIAPPLPAFYNRPSLDRRSRRSHRGANARPIRHLHDDRVPRWDGLMDVGAARHRARTATMSDTRRPRRSEVIDKYSGETIGELPVADAAAVDRAVGRARDAFPAWSATPAHQRSAILRRAAERIDDPEATRSPRSIAREAGKAWKYAIGEVARSVETFTFVGRGGEAHSRRDGADGRVGLRREARRLLPARAAGRRLGDHAVQFPVEPGGAQGRAGARGREHAWC